ncbi:zinc finger, CCHC-type containing protein [Tanacetum coccineum]
MNKTRLYPAKNRPDPYVGIGSGKNVVKTLAVIEQMLKKIEILVQHHKTGQFEKHNCKTLTGLKPEEQKLVLRGKEMDDHKHFLTVGVKGNTNVILVENLPTINEDSETNPISVPIFLSYTADVLWVSMLENRVIRREWDVWNNSGIKAKGMIKGTIKAHGSNIGRAQIVEEKDKESVAENHKHTIGKLKPREPYTQGYQEDFIIFWDSCMKQLILQGFEVEIMGDKCNITHMFDPINGKKDKKSQSERKENGLNDQDQIEVNGKMVSLKYGMSKVLWADDITMSTYLVTRSPSSAIGFKMPIDMNMGFNESEEYKKTSIGSGVCTGSMQVLKGDEFEVEPQDVIHLREDSNEASFAVAAVEKIYAHESLNFNNSVACEVISKWKAGLKDDMDARSDVYVLSNGCKKCNDDSDGYYWESTPGTGSMQVLHEFEFKVKQLGSYLRWNLRRISIKELYREDNNEAAFAVAVVEKIYAHKSLTFNDTVACEVISKWKARLKDDMDARSDVYVLSNGCKKCSDDSDGYYWESTPGHSILSLEGRYAVRSHEYQMVCTRLDIASADMGMLDKFDRGLQTDIQVFVDFDYAMAKAAYMTLTGAWKKEIWLKGLLAESGYELSLVAGIATGALVKGGSRSEVPAQVEGAAYRMPNKYTVGMGTLEDQAKGFADHFNTTVAESSNHRSRGRMEQQWHQSQRNHQGDEGSWINRKLNNIRLKKLHDINKIGILELKLENRNKEELKAKRLKKVRCYKCKEKGHFVNNCPVWKKKGKAKIVEEEDKESVAENHKPTIGKLKPREPYTQVYQERIMISRDYLVLGTENSFWDDFWYVNSTISKHMSPSKHLLYKIKECFFVKEHKFNLLYTHGIGGIKLTTEDTSYTIPYISYVPEININVLSMKQLILQGFEVEIISDKCNITHKFDPINGKKDNKSQSERMEDGLNGQDQIEISYKHKEVFTRKFNDTLKWFHNAKAGKDLEGKLPPKISNVEICLFDFYKFVNNCGGYGKISQTGEWMEIARYYGFPSYCDEDLKKTFEDYLLLPHTYYEFSKGRKPNKYADGLGTFEDQGEGMKPNKYTEGMGTFKDQAKGFADHFSTTVAGMDVVAEPNKHVSNNKAFKEIKKEDDDFVII